jgi:hypothetical protein
MGFDRTYFPHFGQYCIEKIGVDLGGRIYHAAEKRLSSMIDQADYRGNKYIQWHMDTNMLPSIAIYLAFKEFEETADKAYEYTDDVLQISRLQNRKRNQLIGRLPFGYFAFRLFCKSIMNKEYPAQGWDMEWIQYNRNEIHFNMKSCIYFETTQKYNCSEMCTLFCANDDVILVGYKPTIVFERSGTIALGQHVCDFHFKNGRRHK